MSSSEIYFKKNWQKNNSPVKDLKWVFLDYPLHKHHLRKQKQQQASGLISHSKLKWHWWHLQIPWWSELKIRSSLRVENHSSFLWLRFFTNNPIKYEFCYRLHCQVTRTFANFVEQALYYTNRSTSFPLDILLPLPSPFILCLSTSFMCWALLLSLFSILANTYGSIFTQVSHTYSKMLSK